MRKDNIVKLDEFKMTKGLDDSSLQEITIGDYLGDNINKIMLKLKYREEEELKVAELIEKNVKIEDILMIEEVALTLEKPNKIEEIKEPPILLEAPQTVKSKEQLEKEEMEYLEGELKYKEFDKRLRNLVNREKPSFLALFKNKIANLARFN